MWYGKDRDYRVVIRYEHYPVFGGPVEEIAWDLKVKRAVGKMGLEMSHRALAEIGTITVVILQKRVVDGFLSAWHTFSVGYAFCQARDAFSKTDGRRIAFQRALKQMESGVYKEELRKVYNERIPRPVKKRSPRWTEAQIERARTKKLEGKG